MDCSLQAELSNLNGSGVKRNLDNYVPCSPYSYANYLNKNCNGGKVGSHCSVDSTYCGAVEAAEDSGGGGNAVGGSMGVCATVHGKTRGKTDGDGWMSEAVDTATNCHPRRLPPHRHRALAAYKEVRLVNRLVLLYYRSSALETHHAVLVVSFFVPVVFVSELAVLLVHSPLALPQLRFAENRNNHHAARTCLFLLYYQMSGENQEASFHLYFLLLCDSQMIPGLVQSYQFLASYLLPKNKR